MTSALINPAAIAAIKSRRPAGPASPLDGPGRPAPAGCNLTPERAARLNPLQWQRAWLRSSELVADVVEAAMKRDDGTDLAAMLLDHSLNLIAYGITEFAGTKASPRERVRERTETVLQVVWQGMSRSIDAGVALERDELAAEAARILADERDLMTQAADVAHAEARAARQEVEALRRQIAEQRDQAAAELARVTEGRDRERASYIERERGWNEQRRQLEHDRAQVIASLNAELEALSRPLEVLPMPAPVTLPTTPAGRASLCRYAREVLSRPDLKQDDLGEVVTPELLTAWETAYPTPEAQRAHLRPVVAGVRGAA
ncbi:hypothetical protein [Deinococcus sp. Leaf326]|uniref:hypothetical protein n=1 Tax=Deinococcus sp. Leaf326 TaxID=1736338 RepID=UPI0006F4B571|nr:hypothetical protein [Deinococcus sp. Leaf326]KQQ99820.1 hypothetical protein ASF71_21905 [Deinococcus sp. Leaf326]